MASSLSSTAIRALKPRATGHYEVSDGHGLALRVHPSGRLVWMLRATNGRTGERVRREMAEYGDAPGQLGLREARAQAATWRAEFRKGNDPTRPAGRLTVAAGLGEWLRDGALRSGAQIRRRFELHVLPVLGKRLLADVEQRDVAALLRQLQHDKGLRSEVNRVRTSLSALFGWAIAQGEVKLNPVAGTRPLIERSAEREKAGQTRILDLDELTAVWRAGEADLSPTVSALVRLLVLVPLRRQEWTEARWEEIERSADGAQWTMRLPAGRVKGKRPHAVPLPTAAVAILRSMPTREAGFIFSRDGRERFAGWRAAAARLRTAAGIPAWVLHDLRRGVSTAMGEGGIREHVIRRILGHSPRSLLGVTAIYEKSERLEELRMALEQWSATLAAKLDGGASVIPLAAPRRVGNFASPPSLRHKL